MLVVSIQVEQLEHVMCCVLLCYAGTLVLQCTCCADAWYAEPLAQEATCIPMRASETLA